MSGKTKLKKENDISKNMEKKFKKKIILCAEHKREIAQRLGISYYSVGEALRFDTDSVTANRVRLIATEEYFGKVVRIAQP
jgi:hypothetical protein